MTMRSADVKGKDFNFINWAVVTMFGHSQPGPEQRLHDIAIFPCGTFNWFLKVNEVKVSV